MRLVIPINSTQEEFELLLQKNPDVTELNCDGCRSLTSIPQLNNLTLLICNNCTSLTSIPQLDKLIYMCCDFCTNLCVKNIGYLPKLLTHDTKFKDQNEYYYKLTLVRPYISQSFGKYEGFTDDFTDDFMRILETY
jgi:hypothetical protein